jgi:hypothetical protein
MFGPHACDAMTQGYEMDAPRHILKVRYQTFPWQVSAMYHRKPRGRTAERRLSESVRFDDALRSVSTINGNRLRDAETSTRRRHARMSDGLPVSRVAV